MSEQEAQPAMEVIHRVWSDQEASIVVSCLADCGIEAVTNSAVPHEVLPLTVDGLGAVEILVASEEAEEAKRVLAERVAQSEAGSAESDGEEDS